MADYQALSNDPGWAKALARIQKQQSKVSILDSYIEGADKAKVKLEILERLKNKKNGKYIDVIKITASLSKGISTSLKPNKPLIANDFN